MDGLGLEIVGAVEEVGAEEQAPAPIVPRLQRLRDSHHQVARLCATGLSDPEISFQTGYSAQRIWSLRRDPTFCELVEHYRQDRDRVAEAVEEKFRLVAEDARQIIHERLLDEGSEIPLTHALEVFKAMADRAGFAPVQRTVNKNLNLNIGERLDAARRRREIE